MAAVPRRAVLEEMNASSTPAATSGDSAIYQRTTRGQLELLKADDPAASPTLRLLARVNGYTELRRLLELAPGEATAFVAAADRLLEQGFIEAVGVAG